MLALKGFKFESRYKICAIFMIHLFLFILIENIYISNKFLFHHAENMHNATLVLNEKCVFSKSDTASDVF